jgi:DNA-binding MarR family transcriptional regulator
MIQNTSIDAYRFDVLPRLGERQQIVLTALRTSSKPRCNQELADHLDQPINTITPRVNELVEKGLVKEAYRDIYTKTNRRVIFWTASDV